MTSQTSSRAIHNPDQLPVHGFWGGVTSTIDWCELNYEISHYLAEFFNSISNLPMLILGIWSLYQTRSRRLGKRFELLSFLLMIVAVGSFSFHGTLKYEAQLLDELPMVYLGLAFLYCMLEDRPQRKYPWLPWVMIIGAILYSIAYIYVQDWVFFFLPFSLLVAPHAVYFLSFRSDWMAIKNALIANAIFIVAFVAWQLDQKLCPHSEFLQLHAVWHLLTAFSTLANVTFYSYIRWRHIYKCKTARIEWKYFLLPTCVVQEHEIKRALKNSANISRNTSRTTSSPPRKRRTTRSMIQS